MFWISLLILFEMLIKQRYLIFIDGNYQQIHKFAVSRTNPTLDSFDIAQEKSYTIGDLH
jgi:hypothetical protein